MDLQPQVNAQGLALIKASEGFRGNAYKDAVGIWTVGYGHTSMAGPPAVTPKLRVTETEATKLLASDIAKFAAGVGQHIRVPLNANQFSALVSFAYNVGVMAFANSNVLAAVNARDFASVPRRLAMWCKAGGRVLNGLVRRRAAEGALFMADPHITSFGGFMDLSFPDSELAEMQDLRRMIDVPLGKSMFRSTTNWAAIGQWFAATGALLSGAVSKARETMSQYYDITWYLPGEDTTRILLLIGVTAALVWIIKERHRKARDEGV